MRSGFESQILVRVSNLFRVWGFGCISGFGFRVSGFRFQASNLGFMDLSLGTSSGKGWCRSESVLGFRIRESQGRLCFGFWVLGFEDSGVRGCPPQFQAFSGFRMRVEACTTLIDFVSESR